MPWRYYADSAKWPNMIKYKTNTLFKNTPFLAKIGSVVIYDIFFR